MGYPPSGNVRNGKESGRSALRHRGDKFATLLLADKVRGITFLKRPMVNQGEVRRPPQSITVFPHTYNAEQSQCGLRVLTRKTVFSNNAGRAPVMESTPTTFLLMSNAAQMSIPDPSSVNFIAEASVRKALTIAVCRIAAGTRRGEQISVNERPLL